MNRSNKFSKPKNYCRIISTIILQSFRELDISQLHYVPKIVTRTVSHMLALFLKLVHTNVVLSTILFTFVFSTILNYN